ncbi:MAG: diphthamide biosynthesis enzyme Dph2, partial [Nitrososphaerota archaeon]
VVSTSNTWGGCDLAVNEVLKLGLDGLIHMGHSAMLQTYEVPVFHLECRFSDGIPMEDIVERLAKLIDRGKRIGLAATIQYLDYLNILIEEFKKIGLTPITGSGGAKTRYRGQITGCDYTSIWRIIDKVDNILVVGSMFHGIGAAMTVDKPVYVFDPELNRIRETGIEVREILKRRYAWIEVFKNLKKLGVIVGTKIGQRKIGLAKMIKNILKEHGKEAHLVTIDDLTEECLSNMPYEGYVNTACPRLSIEDQIRFKVPLLLPSETLIAVGKVKWEDIIYSPRYLLV